MAAGQLRWLRANNKLASAMILEALDQRVHFDADTPNRNRKRLRSGEWELRVQPYRVIYLVDRERMTVTIVAITHKPREIRMPINEA